MLQNLISIIYFALLYNSKTFSHETTLKIRAPNPADLVGDSMVLKEQLATALEVDFPKLVETLKAHKYILTFDVSGSSWYCY